MAAEITDTYMPTAADLIATAIESGEPLGNNGRFAVANTKAVVIGEHSPRFWKMHAQVLREIEREICLDAGFTIEDAPQALRLAAAGVARAELLEASAFERVAEAGGPVTVHHRTRRSFTVYEKAADRKLGYLRLLGLRRAPRADQDLRAYLETSARETTETAATPTGAVTAVTDQDLDAGA